MRLSSTFYAHRDSEVPMNNYKGSIKEYEAVRNGAGLFNFRSFGKIKIGGKDRIKFLQGLTTNDISKLSVGTGLYTILPTVKGKIASEARVFCFSDHLLLILHPDLKEKTLQILKKYKIGSDVQMEDLTEVLLLLSIQGPRSERILTKWFQTSLPDLQPLQFLSQSLEGEVIQIIRNGWSGEKGFDLLIPAIRGDEYQKGLVEMGTPDGLVFVGEETFETIRIEEGIPQYGSELSEEVLPQEAGLEKTAISYTKGCYIGQETIARLHYLGHTNRSLVGLLLEQDIPEKNDKIVLADKNIGLITSASFSPSLKRAIALAFLQRQFIQPGTDVEIEHHGGRLKGCVAELPFYKPQ